MKVLLVILGLLVARSAQNQPLSDEIIESIINILLKVPFIPKAPEDISDDKVQFYFVDRNTPDPVLLTDQNFQTLITPNKYTVYIIHGYLNTHKEEWYTDMTDAYLDYLDCQVVQVDWGSLSFKTYSESAMYTRGVAKVVAKQIQRVGLNPANVHLVGHSLGAQAVGFVGKDYQYLTGKKIKRITGLDPAGPLFTISSSSNRLDANDGEVVDTLHTDGGVFGILYSIGKIDVYANGGSRLQPGCPYIDLEDVEGLKALIKRVGTTTVSCSHMKAIDYYIESIDEPLYEATECSSWLLYLFGFCSSNDKITFGERMSLSAEQGSYYFKTT